jgi:hypothetical protein
MNEYSPMIEQSPKRPVEDTEEDEYEVPDDDYEE